MKPPQPSSATSGASSGPAGVSHLRFAGFPVSAWAFAFRIWFAMMMALYAAFWLQLQSASSAAVCVGILALPTRGQAYQKAIYRLIGTVVGCIASVVIAGLFNGSRDLFILAFGGWMAVCVYAASLLDGNRAYGAVLSGYTVAIVAVANIDTPQSVFTAGINRGAAIVVGIAALMVFNDLLAAPDVFPGLLARMVSIHRSVKALSRDVLSHGETEPSAVTGLLKTIAALHSDITALPSESVSGRARAAAASRAVTAMVREVAAARAAGVVLAGLGEPGRTRAEALSAVLDDCRGLQAHAVDRQLDEALDAGNAAGPQFVAASTARVLLEQNRATSDALVDMRTGRGPLHGPNLPLFRSREAALRNALRVFLGVTLGSIFFIATGWPSTLFALALLGATSGLSATNANPRQFAIAAVIAMPIAAAMAGITEFVILDGVDAFPLLALGMAPVVIGAGLLLGSGKPRMVPIGFLILVFFPVLLAPSNPQDYNPQTFLINSELAVIAVITLFIVLATVLPTSDALKRAWILRSIRRDFRKALDGVRTRLTVEEIMFRDADRISQLHDLQVDEIDDRANDLRHSLHYETLTSAAWRLRSALANKVLPVGARAEGQIALVSRDPALLRRAADRLLAEVDTAGTNGLAARRWAAATLAWMAVLMERDGQEMAELGGGRFP